MAQEKKNYIEIMEKYNNGSDEEKREAVGEMVELLDKYILKLIHHQWITYASTDRFDDIQQQARLGVIKGMPHYDASAGCPTTFFKKYIIGEIQQYINSEVYRTTAHYAANAKKIREFVKKRESEGLDTEVHDVVQQLGISPLTATRCIDGIEREENTMSIDATDGIEETISSTALSPEDSCIINFEKDCIAQCIDEALTGIEKMVVSIKYTADDKNATYAAIGEKLGISAEEAKKSFGAATRKMKRYFKRHQMFTDRFVESAEREYRTELSFIKTSDDANSFMDSLGEFDDDDNETLNM